MIRVALLGAGEMAEHHARGLRAHRADCSIAGVWGEDSEAAAARADSLGVAAVEDLEQVGEHVDAVIAGDLGEARARIVGSALAKGVDVLIEPPLQMTETEKQRILGGIVRAPRKPVVMVGHDELYNPALSAVRQLVSGMTIVSIDVERHDVRSTGAIPESFDIVGSMLAPDLELVSALMGQPVIATQSAGGRSKPDHPFDHARALLVLEDNTLVTLTASCSGSARVRELKITTTDALLRCDLDRGIVEAIKTVSVDESGSIGSVVHKIDVPYRDPFEVQIESFLDCIARRLKPRLTIGAVMEAEETADAIRNRMALLDRRAPSRRTGKLRAA